MALDLRAIAQAVAETSITGVTVYDLDDVSEMFVGRSCPALYPASGFGSRVTRQTFGGRAAAWKADRLLVYHYLHAPAGEGRTVADQLPGMATNQDAIITALVGAAYPQGTMLAAIECGEFQGELPDPAGMPHLGYTVALAFTEFK